MDSILRLNNYQANGRFSNKNFIIKIYLPQSSSWTSYKLISLKAPQILQCPKAAMIKSAFLLQMAYMEGNCRKWSWVWTYSMMSSRMSCVFKRNLKQKLFLIGSEENACWLIFPNCVCFSVFLQWLHVH